MRTNRRSLRRGTRCQLHISLKLSGSADSCKKELTACYIHYPLFALVRPVCRQPPYPDSPTADDAAHPATADNDCARSVGTYPEFQKTTYDLLKKAR